MATVINNPPSNDSGGPWTLIIVLVVIAVLGYVGIVYGLPALQRMQIGTPQINVPSEIDINVKQSE